MSNAPPRHYSRAWWSASRNYFSHHCVGKISGVLSVSAAAFGVLSFKTVMPGVPFIMQAHGTSWAEAVSKWKTRKLTSIASSIRNILWLPIDMRFYGQFDAVVAAGERVYRDLKRPPVSFVLRPERVHLINNGIDTDLFNSAPLARARIRAEMAIQEIDPVIISATRLHPQKGVAAGLDAFAQFLKASPRARFLIAGDGPERVALEERARELDITRSVRFLGALKREDLVAYLQAADVFIFLTSRIEGLPLNVLEALACGLPSVVSDHLDIFDSPAICRVDPRSPAAVTRALEQMLDEKRDTGFVGLLPADYSLTACAANYRKLLAGLSPNLTGRENYSADSA